MIFAVNANASAFRSVNFKPGLNVVLAHRREESTRRNTRNSLGMTTLLSVIHFCLGGDEKLKDEFLDKNLQDWVFSVDLLLGDERISVSRAIDNSSKVEIDADSGWLDQYCITKFSNSPLQTKMDLGNLREKGKLSVKEWQTILGKGIYDLKDDENFAHQVTFEKLIRYDIRLDQFEKPFEFRPRQFKKDIHLSNAFMLGLNWQYASKWQEINGRIEAIKSEQNVRKEDVHLLAEMPTTIGELETERDRLQRHIDKTDADLSQFRVHPQYTEIESEANNLTRQIHDHSNHILQLKRLIDFHDLSVREEQPGGDSKVIELYQEAGTALSSPVLKRLEDVKEFHIQITRNRRDFLLREVSRLNQELENAVLQREQLSDRKSVLMRVLDTHGAIEEFSRIQKLSDNKRAELESIKRRIEQLIQIETETSKVNIEREKLFLAARIDLDETSSIRRAREIFESNTEVLYEVAGKLIVHLDSSTGYNFDVGIPGSGSAGVDKMKVFCYDLMRAELWSQRDVAPGFLIHDSTIFAGVDERQIARALELAERKSRECGFQYIVCLNSDRVPHNEFTKGFDIQEFVRLTLTDDNPEGSLLGIRF